MIKETARLRKEVEEELQLDDPSQEKVTAILRGENENSKRDDGTRSNESDPESSEESSS